MSALPNVLPFQRVDGHYAKIPHEYHRSWMAALPSYAHRLLGIVIDETTGNKQGVAALTHAMLQKRMGSESTVKRALRVLVAIGAVQVDRREGGRTKGGKGVKPLYSWSREALNAWVKEGGPIDPVLTRKKGLTAPKKGVQMEPLSSKRRGSNVTPPSETKPDFSVVQSSPGFSDVRETVAADAPGNNTTPVETPAPKPAAAPATLLWKAKTETRTGTGIRIIEPDPGTGISACLYNASETLARELNRDHPRRGNLNEAIAEIAKLSSEDWDLLIKQHPKWVPSLREKSGFVPDLARFVRDGDFRDEPPKTCLQLVMEEEAEEAAKRAAEARKAEERAKREAALEAERLIREANRPTREQIARGNRVADALRCKWGSQRWSDYEKREVEYYARNLEDDAHADRVIEAMLHPKPDQPRMGSRAILDATRREAQ